MAAKTFPDKPDWIDAVKSWGEQLHQDYWSHFKPVRESEIRACEDQLKRTFPPDFRAFLVNVGSGPFPERFGGAIYSPAEIWEGCPGPLWMLLGSTDWASPEEHRRLYATRGAFNPAPDRFTKETLNYQGVSLFDLLQIGSNGSCCYHQLCLGSAAGNFGYCLLTPEGTIEDKEPSFTDGLRRIIVGHSENSADLAK
jgi:hypothetical protein